jgi:hypothetical protein
MQGKFLLKLLGRLIWVIIFISVIIFCFVIICDFIGELMSRPAVPPASWPFFLFMMGLTAFLGLLGLLRIVKQHPDEPVAERYVVYCFLGSILTFFLGMLFFNEPWR